MQRISRHTLQPAPVHAVVGLGVANQRLDGLGSLEQALVVIAEQLVLAAVDDLHARDVGVQAPVAKVDDNLLGSVTQVLRQVGGLFQLGTEDMAVVRVAGEAASAHHQTLLVGDRQADLDAELVGVARLALGNALHLWCVQGVELVLGIALLGAYALSALQPQHQIADRLGAASSLRSTSRITTPRNVRWRLTVLRRRLNCLAWA